jgi:cobalamin biosynthesis Co2+ chelatase CbiK
MISHTPFKDLKIVRLITRIVHLIKRIRFELALKRLRKEVMYYKNLKTIPLTYSSDEYEHYAEELFNSINISSTDEQKIFSVFESMKNRNDMVALNFHYEQKVYQSYDYYYLSSYPDFISQLSLYLNHPTLSKIVLLIKTKIKNNGKS